MHQFVLVQTYSAQDVAHAACSIGVAAVRAWHFRLERQLSRSENEFAFAYGEPSFARQQIHGGGNNDVNVLFVATHSDGIDSRRDFDGKLMPIL